jgi:hypothetical protein
MVAFVDIVSHSYAENLPVVEPRTSLDVIKHGLVSRFDKEQQFLQINKGVDSRDSSLAKVVKSIELDRLETEAIRKELYKAQMRLKDREHGHKLRELELETRHEGQTQAINLKHRELEQYRSRLSDQENRLNRVQTELKHSREAAAAATAALEKAKAELAQKDAALEAKDAEISRCRDMMLEAEKDHSFAAAQEQRAKQLNAIEKNRAVESRQRLIGKFCLAQNHGVLSVFFLQWKAFTRTKRSYRDHVIYGHTS